MLIKRAEGDASPEGRKVLADLCSNLVAIGVSNFGPFLWGTLTTDHDTI
jgi:hypothetical protein